MRWSVTRPWDVVGANALGAVAVPTWLFLSAGLGVLRLDSRVQSLERSMRMAAAVLYLAALVLALHHDARGQVRDAHGRESVRLTCWPPARPLDRYSMRRSPGLISTSTSSTSGSRPRWWWRLDAAACLRFRHALHAMHARFVFQARIGALAPHQQGKLLHAAKLGDVGIQLRHLPPRFSA